LSSKATVIANKIVGKILSIIGYAVGSIFLLIFIIGITDQTMTASEKTPALILCITFIITALLLIRKGANIKHTIHRFNKYVRLISEEHMNYIGKIAESTLQSVDFVKNDLQKLIDKKYFVNAYIDANLNEIIIGHRYDQSSQENIQSNLSSAEYESIRCSGCGAVTSVPIGTSAVCEYCGAQLK